MSLSRGALRSSLRTLVRSIRILSIESSESVVVVVQDEEEDAVDAETLVKTVGWNTLWLLLLLLLLVLSRPSFLLLLLEKRPLHDARVVVVECCCCANASVSGSSENKLTAEP